MRDAQAEEPVEHLLSRAAEAGFPLTRVQLHRWQREGLLPRPRQKGLGRGRGTEVLYPPGSARQLVALCDQLQMKRSLLDACWVLWWNGFPIEEARIRVLFDAKAKQWEFLQAAEGHEKFTAFIDEWARGRGPHSTVLSIRQRTGVDRFPRFLKQVLKFGVGKFDGFASGDAEIAAAGFGLPDSHGLEEQLRATSYAYDPRRLREALDSSSLADLEEARDEVRGVVEFSTALIALFGELSSRALPRSFAIALKRPSLDDGLYLVLFWLSVRRMPSIRKMYEGFLSIIRSVSEGTVSPVDALDTDIPLESSDQRSED